MRPVRGGGGASGESPGGRKAKCAGQCEGVRLWGNWVAPAGQYQATSGAQECRAAEGATTTGKGAEEKYEGKSKDWRTSS